MAAVPENVQKLSYRELGEKLGISPDGARMKAKRKAKEGIWRIVPGNHPSDRVIVEIPANDLAVRSRRGGTVFPKIQSEQHPNIAERLIDELALARARNDALTDKLIGAKDVLSTAYDKLISLNQELVSARIDLIGAKDEVIAAKEAHQRDERELVAAEMREMGTKVELERALADLAALSSQAHKRRWRWGRP